MKNQGNATIPKCHNSLVTRSKDIKIVKMSDKEFKRMIFKSSMIFKKIEISNSRKLSTQCRL
jgi:hypothetical protein